MKRNIFLLAALFMLVIAPATSQNLSLSNDLGAVAPNSTIVIWGDTGMSSTIYAHIFVTNNSSSDMDVLVKKAEISVLPGSENSFCWGSCYIPTVFVSPIAVPIAAGVTDEASFSGDYKPKGQTGSTTIRYTFFNKANVNDSVAVYFEFNSGTASINNRPAAIEFSSAFPNPASSMVNFNYNLQGNTGLSEFVITDLLGSELYKVRLENMESKLTVDVSSFDSGVYFYSLRINGKPSFTRKLIVRH